MRSVRSASAEWMAEIEEVMQLLCPAVPKDNETRNPRYYNCWNSGLFVGLTGFEPATFCSQSRRATKLRYSPFVFETQFAHEHKELL